jgi:hypothetical protein
MTSTSSEDCQIVDRLPVFLARIGRLLVDPNFADRQISFFINNLNRAIPSPRMWHAACTVQAFGPRIKIRKTFSDFLPGG